MKTLKETINNNIGKYGHHISIVSSDLEPRYAYTIGVKEKLGFELVFAGGVYYMSDDILKIINHIVDRLPISSTSDIFKIDKLGSFSLSKVHISWSSLMMLGVFDYYKQKSVEAFQIIPDSEHYTLDIPLMANEWHEVSEPVWKWLVKEWEYHVSGKSKVVTNISSLRGEKITEIMRWEEDEWEAFVGNSNEVKKDDIRVVSLATLIGIDSTLLPMLTLDIGKGLWRDPVELKWNSWK